MPRQPRPDYTHTYHHVVVRGVDGLPIFARAEMKLAYMDIMKDARKTHDLSVYALGFMGNHVHQFVRRNHHSLGVFYRRVNGRYARWYNRRKGRTGTLYDQRYFSTLVDSDSYFDAAWRYVHHQGVKAGLYEMATEDPWSSAGVYVGQSTRFRWIDWEEAIEEMDVSFGKEARRLLSKRGMETPWYDTTELPYEIHRGQRFLAGERFLETYMQIRKSRVRRKARAETPIPWKTLVEHAQALSGAAAKDLLTPSKIPDRSRHRGGLAYAACLYGHLSIGMIAKSLRVSLSGVSRMIRRAKDRDAELTENWDRVFGS